ncbi:Stp1/IreP family PP2C-type Ser/Thr phosphatase [Ktedonospora formicarum]|uniref:PPM-type phosphatase domain-containing protein n=1 Tax=Ktedonospora formicarum TaxID=2778364 RepID=A0A8J3I1M9_9CHLR|nr:Stp1/IreP family PP2C-type Ser/Thr phosphatase [Ktedonospora formicarum]GHO43864.1 hypothetical protein KSX_20270 [Ktedonospora formicarum]
MDSSLHLTVASRTDTGRKRSLNEDNLLAIVPEDPTALCERGALLIVADGLGGHARGEVASDMVINAVNKFYYADQDHEEDIAQSLKLAISQANIELFKRAVQEGNDMGTTCVACVVQGEQAYFANVGDSRAYIVRDGSARQVTQDHSWVAEQVRVGLITEAQARVHPQRNVILRSLGIDPGVGIDLFTEQLQDGDTLLLCSDGLSGMVEDAKIAEIIAAYEPAESVDKLIEQANAEGGLDNITAIVARVSRGDANQEMSDTRV